MPIARTIFTWGEMIKFSHSVFALPFALIATFLAARPARPTLGQLSLIVVCMVAARSFAMTINRLADASLDARNPRTAGRALPAGRIRPGQAAVFAVLAAGLLIAGCFGFQHFYANSLPLKLVLPTLALLATYSFTKRFTTLAHFVLGAAIAFAPVAAWIAINPATLGRPALLICGAVLFWIAGFDLIYACQDVNSDRREGLFSIPARHGIARALLLSRGCHLVTITLLIALGRIEHLGALYWSALAATAILLLIEQSLVRPNDLSKVNLAFFTVNGIVSLALGAATIGDIIIRK